MNDILKSKDLPHGWPPDRRHYVEQTEQAAERFSGVITSELLPLDVRKANQADINRIEDRIRKAIVALCDKPAPVVPFEVPA